MKTIVSLVIAAGLGAGVMTATGFADPKTGDAASTKSDPRIGEEVRSICFGSSINGWRSVKGEDDVVLLERGVNQWYRVELVGGCDERLFRSAFSINIESTPGSLCVGKGDVIIVEDSPSFQRRCFIKRIYKWDEDAVLDEDENTEDDA